jgi:hypothetical protein
MNQPLEPDIQAVVTLALHRAIRRIAARILATPGVLKPGDYRQVQYYMRMALSLIGVEGKMPTVMYHGLTQPGAGPIPEILSLELPDFLAARAGTHLAQALEGQPEARAAIEREAEQILLTENVQLV